MALELYNDGAHVCLMFSDLVKDADEAVQSNQFLVVDNGHGAVIDPGGNMTYNALVMALARFFPPKKLDYVLASHADPDIIASVNRIVPQHGLPFKGKAACAQFVDWVENLNCGVDRMGPQHYQLP